ncbi:MAG: hypothetical protein OXG51_14165, partial [Gammaproteobacteria bacterium]|nr:hypothetical protein [Gammaproteobacteria bacterium]
MKQEIRLHRGSVGQADYVKATDLSESVAAKESTHLGGERLPRVQFLEGSFHVHVLERVKQRRGGAQHFEFESLHIDFQQRGGGDVRRVEIIAERAHNHRDQPRLLRTGEARHLLGRDRQQRGAVRSGAQVHCRSAALRRNG